jgi:tetrapyrrole methylase family protein/MazG family protein
MHRTYTNEELGEFSTFREIMAILRAPDGCPWDREQTHESIKSYLLEETYEALEALDERNLPKFCDEMGDILLQIGLHSQMAEEAGVFSITDVIRAINTKVLRRHPHVFGDAGARSVQEVWQNWEELKAQERESDVSALASVPKALPALAQGKALQDRAERLGLKIELDREAPSSADSEQALGELLYALMAQARHSGIDPEEAMRKANAGFRRRFESLEQAAKERGTRIEEFTEDEQRAIWEASG